MNPYYGLFDFDEVGWEALTKNNVTREVVRYGHVYDNYDETNYVYTYDGKFPSTQTYTWVFTYDNERGINTTTYYYEYK